MLRARKKKLTAAEYLAMEEVAPYKSEYHRGLQEYILVDSEQAHIEWLRRRDGKWTVSRFDGLDAACRFESLDCEIPLSHIYQKVTWLD